MHDHYYFANFSSYGSRQAGYFNGMEKMFIENSTGTNMSLSVREGFKMQFCKAVLLENVRIEAKEGPPMATNYIQKLEINALRMNSTPTPLVTLENTSDVIIHECVVSAALKDVLNIGNGCEKVVDMNKVMVSPH